MVELRVQREQAQDAEQHLCDDRNECRQTAQHLQYIANQEDGSPTDLGPSGGGGGGGGGGSPSRDHDHRDGDPPGPPPPGDPAGGDDPEITEVKISRRDADKVVVPPYPKVTHL